MQRPNRTPLFLVFIALASLIAAVLYFCYVGPKSHNAAGRRAPLSPFQKKIAANLDAQCRSNIAYRDGYYVGGDPPPDVGVCTDVVIRSYRAAGIDLKRLVATDIRARRAAYHIGKPDPNIDYRRTRNLAVFFERHARSLPISGASADWQAGDVVVFSTRNNGYADHIGVVASETLMGQPEIVQAVPGRSVGLSPFVGVIPMLYHLRWVSKR